MLPLHFTVIIPTRDRCETLPYTLQSCLAQTYENFSIIVSDNASQDETRQIVASFDHPRLRYINPGRRLSMSANFDFALSAAEGDGFVTCIGDDDGLMPGALQAAALLIQRHGGLPLACPSVYYGWPGLPDVRTANRMHMFFAAEQYEVRDSRETIQRRICFSDGKERYVWGLPGIYRGFVPLALVRSGVQNGRYIHSVTPDAYSAFLTALQAGQYLFTNRPLFIEGVSAKSNGASQALFADAAEERKYVAENDLSIHDSLVYCTAPSVVMTEAFLQVKAQFPALTDGLVPDLQRMIVNSRLETTPLKRAGVEAALEAIARKNGLSPPGRWMTALGRSRRRYESVVNALRSIEIACDALGINDVYAASIAANAIWNQRQGIGVRSGSGVLRERIERLLIKRHQ